MKTTDSFESGRLARFLLRHFGLLRLRRLPALACLASFVASVLATITFVNLESEWQWAHGEFEAGMVADRDVVAGYPLSYVDEDATRLRMEAQRSLVPAVFLYAPHATREALGAWEEFNDFADGLEGQGMSLALMQLTVQAEYPGFFAPQAVVSFLSAPDRAAFRGYGREVLGAVLSRRVFALGGADLGNYNPDVVELLTLLGYRAERERIRRDAAVSMQNAGAALMQAAEALSLPPAFAGLAPALLLPFVRENAAFSPEDTQMRVAETMERVPAVVRTIEQGQRIIRQGFVITQQDMQDLYALRAALPMQAPRNHAGKILLLALLYVLFILLQGRPVLGKELPDGQSCLLFVLLFLYLAGAGLTRSLTPGDLPVSLFFPTALMVMIPAVFMGHLAAFALALAFPLSAVIVGFFDVPSYVFALVSGLAASVVFRKAEKRMDLIKAGMKIAGANCLAVIVILLMRAADFSAYPPMMAWAVLNGVVAGMLMLGVLPPLEYFLNAATTFRLIELSDLNAPILRKLFTTAPGTYSHSVMVATLAEQACQDIGANALLARVGAYYHDIGKMENPDYFVENQTD
ncbi:MAG: HDIG domain-containing protein, partial [Treponema sp.]|nr:HDIG domain-containing protein [Treponema sp.]